MINDFLQESINQLSGNLFRKEEELIKEALIRNGFNPFNMQFLKDNFIIINNEEDGFDHYYFHYGKPDEIRIISFERNPEMIMNQSNKNKVTFTANKKYY